MADKPTKTAVIEGLRATKRARAEEILDAFKRDLLFNLGQVAPREIYDATFFQVDILERQILTLFDGVG